ncbi:MAG: NusG domain II-containing protein [Duodenibacillus sp.]|nr:NusG domain II-containing protein [Duodenibacillus sp.]
MSKIGTKAWCMILAGAFLLCLGAGFLLLKLPGGTVANVYRDGELIWSVDLAKVTAPFEKSFTDESGTNTLLVEPGRISMSFADCPDLVCVNTGTISNGAMPIVCLPHRLAVRIEKTGADPFDGVAQ